MNIIITDSITLLPAETLDAVALAASHGGSYCAGCALRAGLRGVIFSDAGIGREQAGVAGLRLLEQHGVAAAAISHRSARIGDGSDCHRRGVISFSNTAARRLGVDAGMHASAALDVFARAATATLGAVATETAEHRHVLSEFGPTKVVIADSASLLTADDEDAIVVTGSHGGLLGGRESAAVKAPVRAIVFNDADRGVNDAGLARLAVLDDRGIAAATVSAWSARIGDGLSSYRDGYVSAINRNAAGLGGEIGIPATELVARWAAANPRG
jgi:hypothetical protein